MTVEKIINASPAHPVHSKDRSMIREDHTEKPRPGFYEEDVLEETYSSRKPKESKWGLFTPLLVIFVVAGAILLFA